jgi:hypothetical protein
MCLGRSAGSTKKLEQEIAKREPQTIRITANPEGMEGDVSISCGSNWSRNASGVSDRRPPA